VNRYLLDANAIITPFHEGPLRALASALSLNQELNQEEAKVVLEDWLEDGVSSGRFLIADMVQEEVLGEKGKAKPGYEALWKLKDGYKPISPTVEELALSAKVQAFVDKHFQPHDAQSFARGADPLLVAIAKARRLTIITQERHTIPEVDGNTGRVKGKPTLTYVAFAFRVRCLSLMSALVEEPPKLLLL
jgi:hypothetical protein